MVVTNGSSLSSALYVVDLKKFRKIAAGDRLRGQYQGLSQDPNSLSNLDQVSVLFWGTLSVLGIQCVRKRSICFSVLSSVGTVLCFFTERNCVCVCMTFSSVLPRRHTQGKCRGLSVAWKGMGGGAAPLNITVFSVCTQASWIHLFLCLLGSVYSFSLGTN